eukprot:137173-Chlamydomonas_euryale.AAC.1
MTCVADGPPPGVVAEPPSAACVDRCKLPAVVNFPGRVTWHEPLSTKTLCPQRIDGFPHVCVIEKGFHMANLCMLLTTCCRFRCGHMRASGRNVHASARLLIEWAFHHPVACRAAMPSPSCLQSGHAPTQLLAEWACPHPVACRVGMPPRGCLQSGHASARLFAEWACSHPVACRVGMPPP